MSKKKKNKLKATLNKLYENDKTLVYLKQYEDTKYNLLTSSWDNNISTDIDKLRELLSNNYIQNAFPNKEEYKKYSEPILDTMNAHDYVTLYKLISNPINSSLKTDYDQLLKATSIFSDSLEKVSDLGLEKSSYYNSKLNKTINRYETDKIKVSEDLLNLAYSINNDTFESSVSKNLGLASAGLDLAGLNSPASKNLGLASAGFDLANSESPLSKSFGLASAGLDLAGLNSPTSKNLGLASAGFDLANSESPLSKSFGLASIKNIGLNNTALTKKIKNLSSFKTKIKPIKLDNITINPPLDFKPLEIPKVQDSPIYKQNERQIEVIQEMSKYLIELGEKQEIQANTTNKQNIDFLNNSHKQVELMADISGFLSSQREILETQNKNQEVQGKNLSEQNNELLNNSHEQIKLMTEVSNFLSLQSKILEIQKQNQELQKEKMEEQVQELKQQNITMTTQIKDNNKSSKIALWTAIISIFIGAIVSLGSGYLTYYVYIEEDKSDSINHKELKKVIHNSNNKNQDKLIKQLILQNKNITSLKSTF